jgi:ribosomal-protein-alanine N-acetyltransferase
MNTKQPTGFPIITTERLILRDLNMNDADEIFKLRSDERVNKYLDRPKTTTRVEAEEFIKKINYSVNNSVSFYWAISLKTGSGLIGTICFWNLDAENGRAEMGYELHPDFQGKGLMQEAISAVIAYGFEKLQFKTIVAFPDAANERSIKILEKNKFVRDAALEGEYYKNDPAAKELVYSLKSSL